MGVEGLRATVQPNGEVVAGLSAIQQRFSTGAIWQYLERCLAVKTGGRCCWNQVCRGQGHC